MYLHTYIHTHTYLLKRESYHRFCSEDICLRLGWIATMFHITPALIFSARPLPPPSPALALALLRVASSGFVSTQTWQSASEPRALLPSTVTCRGHAASLPRQLLCLHAVAWAKTQVLVFYLRGFSSELNGDVGGLSSSPMR